MKKYIILAVFSIVLTANVNAEIGNYSQSTSDGFFQKTYTKEYRAYSDWGAMPRMLGHGIETNQNAPLGTGLLLLTGMGLGYAVVKRRRNK